MLIPGFRVKLYAWEHAFLRQVVKVKVLTLVVYKLKKYKSSRSLAAS
jgi:hypothetical protein